MTLHNKDARVQVGNMETFLFLKALQILVATQICSFFYKKDGLKYYHKKLNQCSTLASTSSLFGLDLSHLTDAIELMLYLLAFG